MALSEKIKKVISEINRYATIAVFIFFYLVLSSGLKRLSVDDRIIVIWQVSIQTSALSGIITQVQMLTSVYLVLKQNKLGYIISCVLNLYSIMFAVAFMIQTDSSIALPGVISYFGVLMILTMIMFYKKRATDYINKIESHKKSLLASEKKLHHMAYYDALTGLPNKELYVSRLKQNIQLSNKNGSLIGVMFVDLDAFKSINDTMGHSVGDLVLKTIAERIAGCLRKEDTVSRFGGDEFLIQIAHVETLEALHEISQKIMETFQKPVYVQNAEFMMTASIGVAVYPYDGSDSEMLIKNADIAMYFAKSKGKNLCEYCTPYLKEDVVRKLKLTNSLYKALENNELFLHYQPQVKVDTKEIIGFEALLRWQNAEYGRVPPDVFIPLAETTGLIIPIGLWVFRTACEECVKCSEMFQKNYRISINLSLEQLKDLNFMTHISQILEETQVNASSIQIEITESIAFTEESSVLQRLQDLKNLGIAISIDDFGTGHSSLSRLRTFPIDLIKIDMEFVQGISTNSHKEKEIVKSIIQLAKNLGIGVLAEGVEEEAQYHFLKDEQCDEIQGYYFYRPMAAEDVREILYKQRTE